MNNFKYLNGIKLYSFANFDELIDEAVKTKSILVALNSDKLIYCDDKLKSIINNNIGYPDGIGAVWALKRNGFKSVKLAGCELWLEIIKRYPTSSYYLVGAEQEVIDSVISKLKQEFPEINILGYRNGFFKDGEESDNLINDIVSAKPDFVFVAMGSPKQEFFLNRIHQKHQTVMMGLGGSFNVYAGKVKRAPNWMLKMNIEFVYRYLFCNIKFVRLKSDIKFVWNLIFNNFN